MTLALNSDNQVLPHSHYQPCGFSGKERDDSWLLYFEARYYDPLSGRFISPDPLFSEQMDKCMSSVIECNLYQYTGNNPVMFVNIEDEAKKGRFGLEVAKKLISSILSFGGITDEKSKKIDDDFTVKNATEIVKESDKN